MVSVLMTYLGLISMYHNLDINLSRTVSSIFTAHITLLVPITIKSDLITVC